MSNPIPFQLTNESIVVVVDGKPVTVQKGTAQYVGLRDALIQAMQTDDWSSVSNHLTIAGSLTQWLGDKFTLLGNAISFRGLRIHQNVERRIFTMAAAGESPAPLFNFWERLQNNPSKRSVDCLFDFLKHENIPIEPDGTFLAYKGVKDDLTDCHTGTFDNSPGKVHEMERNLVSDDPRHACHAGFHVGAPKYALDFGPTAMIVRVAPENVVCVPYDHSQHKMRVCKYEVVGFYSGKLMPSTTMVDDTKAEPEWATNEDDGDDEDILDTDPSDIVDGDVGGDEYVPAAEIYDEDPKLAKKPVKPVKPVSYAAKFGRMDGKKLMEQSIDDLRKYASQTLKIVGASKLPGGKAALVGKITATRRKRK